MSRDDTINMEHYEILSLAHKICNVCQKLSKRCPGGLCGNAVRKAKEIYYSQFAKDKKVRANGMREKQMIEEMAKATMKHCEIDNQCGSCHWSTCNECLSVVLYNAGYRKQEWISVDERLPESGVHCLISCTVKRFDGTHGQYVCVGYYAEKFKHLAYGVDDDSVSEYNEENDEYYIAEGWYEVIKNWDDYGFVAIDDFVTHWMPLPEAPKMKGGEE